MAQTTIEAKLTRWAPVRPGEFKFYSTIDDQVAGIIFACPCGCGQRYVVSLRFTQYHPGEYCWQWDGNQEHPTLRPSIHAEHCGWHGWLEAGKWVSV